MNFQALGRPTGLIKIVHIVLCILCIGLTATEMSVMVTVNMSSTAESVSRELMVKLEVVHATYFGFFMLSTVMVLSYILDSPINTKLVMLISACATLMFITAGALNIQFYDKVPEKLRKDQILVAGIVAIINSLAYAADIFLSWKFGG